MRHRNLFSFVAVVTAFAAVVPSYARVAVTSAAEGDPVGKPPTDAERILRVGIDIQANELVSTQENDRAHVVFLDGTSLTVGPNARIKIDKFVYDPSTKTGKIAISVVTGVFRVVGGKITKSQALTVTTPSAEIGIRGGIALVEVSGQETKARFLFGKSMVVSAHGRSEIAIRPGSEIITYFGNAPGAPGLVPVGGLASVLAQLDAHPKRGKGDDRPDKQARDSGFSSQNSGRGVPAQIVAPVLPSAATDAVNNAGLLRNQPVLPAVASVSPVAASISPTAAPPPIVLYDPWCRDEHRNIRHDRFQRR